MSDQKISSFSELIDKNVSVDPEGPLLFACNGNRDLMNGLLFAASQGGFTGPEKYAVGYACLVAWKAGSDLAATRSRESCETQAQKYFREYGESMDRASQADGYVPDGFCFEDHIDPQNLFHDRSKCELCLRNARSSQAEPDGTAPQGPPEVGR